MQFLKFTLVGIINRILGLGLYYILVTNYQYSIYISIYLMYIFNFFFSLYLQTIFTFKSKVTLNKTIKILLIVIFTSNFNSLLMKILLYYTNINHLHLQITLTVAISVLGFFLLKKINTKYKNNLS